MKVFVLMLAMGCASKSLSGEQRVQIIRPNEQAQKTQGIPTDKELEIQTLLQQRENSVLRCYQDVLNEKKDRNFAGTMQILISLETSGRASSVTVTGGTLKDKEVADCVTRTVAGFDYPQLTQPGQTQYTYQFRPAY